MRPMRFSLILIKGANMIPLAQTGRSNLAPRLVPAGDLMVLAVVARLHRSIMITEPAVFPISSRRFLGALTRWELERGEVCAAISAGVQGIILNSLLR